MKEFASKRLGLTIAIIAGLAASTASAAVWQYSVPAPTAEGRRAYLWVPPECKQVRGVVVACQNMLEKPLFERPAFRDAAAENGLGLLLVYPGRDRGNDGKDDHPETRSAFELFLNPTFPNGPENPQGAGKDLQAILDALAKESGYAELRQVPLVLVGHSSAGSFVWHLAEWNPDRILALLPFKTASKDDYVPQGIPILHIESEWFDYGTDNHDMWSKPSAMEFKMRTRAHDDDSLYGLYVDIGSGHCNVSDDSIQIFSLFLEKVVAARIPSFVPKNGPVRLKPVQEKSGWLIDPMLLGKADGKPVAYKDWKGDPKKALWYIDREFAEAVQNHMAEQLAKQPQHVGFLKDGQPLAAGGMFKFSPKFIDDAGTFTIEADWVDHLDNSDLQPARTNLQHSASPILYRVNSGCLVQTGPNTFRVCPHFGPTMHQGNPWEPTIIAYHPGDGAFRPTDQPAHANLNIVNKDGASQTIDFEKIPDQKAGLLKPIKLHAAASSGLPVQFIMVSGPADIEGDTLTFDPLPVGTRFPIRVLVSAFQWGRPWEPKVQSAGPIMQEFFIRK